MTSNFDKTLNSKYCIDWITGNCTWFYYKKTCAGPI